jgi:hypothetical protein
MRRSFIPLLLAATLTTIIGVSIIGCGSRKPNASPSPTLTHTLDESKPITKATINLRGVMSNLYKVHDATENRFVVLADCYCDGKLDYFGVLNREENHYDCRGSCTSPNQEYGPIFSQVIRLEQNGAEFGNENLEFPNGQDGIFICNPNVNFKN